MKPDMTAAEAHAATEMIRGNIDAGVDLFFKLPLDEQREFVREALVAAMTDRLRGL